MGNLINMGRYGKRMRAAAGSTSLAVGIVGLTFAAPMSAIAASTSMMPTAKISFTFDDGLTSALTKAAPALAQYGYTGTDYVITGCVGTTNKCPADESAKYMTWPQITQLQNTNHWEIGSHTVNHPLLTEVSATKLTNELVNSKQALASHGIDATDFASPYGDYNPKVLAAVSKYYSSHRPFADQQFTNSWPYNDYLLYVKQVQAGVTVAQVKSYIDEAKQKNAWLVLVMHDIQDVPSTNPDDYQYGTNDLKQIAAYAQSQNMLGVNVNQGLAGTGGANLLANSTFDNGIADGWTTDVAANVTKDTANNGSYPSPTNSLLIKSNTSKSVHLFSPKVSVDSTKSYFLKNFVNITKRSAGQLSFYIDEYDVNGNWVSGHTAVSESVVNVENMNFVYKPSSAAVKQASVQVAVDKGSNLQAYVDNMQWFEQQ
jgi:peptidoglycan/xylan/chitin deacetylase (PgdA/CDA1 family)